jgi:hypothetical protein
MGDKSGQSVQQLLHPAVDAGDLAHNRRKPVLGDLRHNGVWGGCHFGGLAHSADGGSRRGGAGVNLRVGAWRSVRAVDRIAQSIISVALGHDLWRWSRRWRLPGRPQLTIGPDLSAGHPLDRRGLGARRGTCRDHCRSASWRRVAGARLASARYLHRARHPRIRHHAIDGDARAIAAVKLTPESNGYACPSWVISGGGRPSWSCPLVLPELT